MLYYPYEDFEADWLNRVDDTIAVNSEMSKTERLFLNGLIRTVKPKKILEIGVAAGASSAVILNAIKDDPTAHLFSVDYAKNYYRIPDKQAGFIVYDNFTEFLPQWTMRAGMLAVSCLDDIGKDIDLCLLDTTHSLPGESIEYLAVLPYLKKNAIVIIHDISLHTIRVAATVASVEKKHQENETFAMQSRRTGLPLLVGCSVLFSALKGDKKLPTKTEYTFPNIGAVTLSDDALDDAVSVFNLLTLPWAYQQYDAQGLKTIERHFQKHYPEHLVDIFRKAVAVNNELIRYTNKIYPLGTQQIETAFKEILALKEQISELEKLKKLFMKPVWILFPLLCERILVRLFCDTPRYGKYLGDRNAFFADGKSRWLKHYYSFFTSLK